MELNFYYENHNDSGFDLNKEVKRKLFNGLADWIIDREPNYPSFIDAAEAIHSTL